MAAAATMPMMMASQAAMAALQAQALAQELQQAEENIMMDELKHQGKLLTDTSQISN